MHVVGKGEPFLDDARGLALLGAIRRRRELYFTLATSALHLSPALCDAAARTPNVLLLLSIDGFEALHDERRGVGTHVQIGGRAFLNPIALARHKTQEDAAARFFLESLRD